VRVNAEKLNVSPRLLELVGGARCAAKGSLFLLKDCKQLVVLDVSHRYLCAART